MARYTTNHQTAAGSPVCIFLLIGTAAIRTKVYDLIIGSDATPADVATEFSVIRHTDVGTGGSSLTIAPLDPLTVAATATGTGGTFSVQPSYGNVLMNLALNQRATFRWVAAPGGEFISTAAASNGIALRSTGSGGTPNINTSVYWDE